MSPYIVTCSYHGNYKRILDGTGKISNSIQANSFILMRRRANEVDNREAGIVRIMSCCLLRKVLNIICMHLKQSALRGCTVIPLNRLDGEAINQIVCGMNCCWKYFVTYWLLHVLFFVYGVARITWAISWNLIAVVETTLFYCITFLI